MPFNNFNLCNRNFFRLISTFLQQKKKAKIFSLLQQYPHTFRPLRIFTHIFLKQFLYFLSRAFSLCRPDYRPKHGIYDLQIKNASYIRDNGRFECRIKAKGTGADVHQEFYNLTVLTPPHPPVISPGNVAIATEDVKMELTCSSIGGSPDPTIT